MANNIEGAEMLERNIEHTNKLLEQMTALLDKLTSAGIEDTTELEANLKDMRDVNERNIKTAKLIRDTAE